MEHPEEPATPIHAGGQFLARFVQQLVSVSIDLAVGIIPFWIGLSFVVAFVATIINITTGPIRAITLPSTNIWLDTFLQIWVTPITFLLATTAAIVWAAGFAWYLIPEGHTAPIEPPIDADSSEGAVERTTRRVIASNHAVVTIMAAALSGQAVVYISTSGLLGGQLAVLQFVAPWVTIGVVLYEQRESAVNGTSLGFHECGIALAIVSLIFLIPLAVVVRWIRIGGDATEAGLKAIFTVLRDSLFSHEEGDSVGRMVSDVLGQRLV